MRPKVWLLYSGTGSAFPRCTPSKFLLGDNLAVWELKFNIKVSLTFNFYYSYYYFVIGNLDLKDTSLFLRFDLIFLFRLEIKKENVDEDSVVPILPVQFSKKDIILFPVPTPSYCYLNTLLLLLLVVNPCFPQSLISNNFNIESNYLMESRASNNYGN